jgi:hypothetical protein
MEDNKLLHFTEAMLLMLTDTTRVAGDYIQVKGNDLRGITFAVVRKLRKSEVKSHLPCGYKTRSEKHFVGGHTVLVGSRTNMHENSVSIRRLLAMVALETRSAISLSRLIITDRSCIERNC